MREPDVLSYHFILASTIGQNTLWLHCRDRMLYFRMDRFNVTGVQSLAKDSLTLVSMGSFEDMGIFHVFLLSFDRGGGYIYP